jgi:hypothetical protein
MCGAEEVGDASLGWAAREAAALREQDASDFGTELLTPADRTRPLCEVDRPSLVHVDALARTAGVSRAMAALRFVELAPEPCAVVYAERGRVAWSARNDDFRVFLPDRGVRVDPHTAAGGRRATTALEPVDVEAWGHATGRDDVELWEETAVLDEWDATLTWLWHPMR